MENKTSNSKPIKILGDIVYYFLCIIAILLSIALILLFISCILFILIQGFFSKNPQSLGPVNMMGFSMQPKDTVFKSVFLDACKKMFDFADYVRNRIIARNEIKKKNEKWCLRLLKFLLRTYKIFLHIHSLLA